MPPFLRLTYDEAIMRLCDFFGKEKEKESIRIYASKSKMTQIEGRWFIHSFIPPVPSYFVYNLVFGVQNVALGKRILMNIDLSVTGRCHCRCMHCFRTKSKTDLPFSHFKKLIDTLARMRMVNIELTGGEALLREDLEDIVSHASMAGNIIFYTTGHGLTPKRAKRLKDSGVNTAVISLDHYTEREHDLRRRYRGAFKEAIDAVGLFNDVGVYTSITVVPMGNLVDEAEMYRYIDFARSIGTREVRVAMPIPMGRFFGQDYMKKMKEFREKLFEIRDKVNRDVSFPTIFLFQAFESGEIMGCGAGFFYCSVNNTGDVYPCVAVPISFGNILEEDFETIWERMGEYFKTPGGTCYGRIASSVLKPVLHKMDRTVRIEDLEGVKEKLIVDEGRLPNVFTPFETGVKRR